MTRERSTRFGYKSNGEYRAALPKNFWKDQEWVVPDNVSESDYPIMCIRSCELPKIIKRKLPNAIITPKTVVQWFVPSKDYQIPGVYREANKTSLPNGMSLPGIVWVHRDIVGQMIEKLKNDPRLIWENDKNLDPGESAILRKIGGLQGQTTQLYHRIAKLEKEIKDRPAGCAYDDTELHQAICMVAAHFSVAIGEIAKWISDNFSVKFRFVEEAHNKAIELIDIDEKRKTIHP